jgi:hypothetical protein
MGCHVIYSAKMFTDVSEERAASFLRISLLCYGNGGRCLDIPALDDLTPVEIEGYVSA